MIIFLFIHFISFLVRVEHLIVLLNPQSFQIVFKKIIFEWENVPLVSIKTKMKSIRDRDGEVIANTKLRMKKWMNCLKFGLIDVSRNRWHFMKKYSIRLMFFTFDIKIINQFSYTEYQQNTKSNSKHEVYKFDIFKRVKVFMHKFRRWMI